MNWYRKYIVARYGGSEEERGIWYHGTRGKNLPTILSQGLIPEPKQRAWSRETAGSFNNPSLASIGGIYVTTNLMTAYSSAGRHVRRNEESKVIVVMELQPRSLVADEDDLTFRVQDSVGGNLGGSEYHVAEAFMLKELGTGKEYIDGLKKSYKEAILRNQRLRDIHPELKKSIGQILDEMWEVALDRQAAYIYKGNDLDFEWKRAFWHSAGELAEREQEEIRNKEKVDGHPITEEDANVIILKYIPKHPNQQQMEDKYRAYVDRLTKLLKNYPRGMVDTGLGEVGRSLKPIGFSGSNKIIAIAEIIDEPTYSLEPRRDLVRVVYGTLPQEFIGNWEQRIGKLKLVK